MIYLQPYHREIKQNVSGAVGENRTHDLFITNEVHYHCATTARLIRPENKHKDAFGVLTPLILYSPQNIERQWFFGVIS